MDLNLGMEAKEGPIPIECFQSFVVIELVHFPYLQVRGLFL